MRVNSRVKMNMGRIKQLSKAAILALEQTAEALHTEVIQAQTMPFKTGNLQNESTFIDYHNAKDGNVILVTNTPYARRLYYHPEYQYHKDENPNAGGEWYKDYLEKGEKADFAKETFKRLYKQEGDV